jgi:hypothetical protein
MVCNKSRVLCFLIMFWAIAVPAQGFWPWRGVGEDEQKRAGYPQEQSRLAHPGINPRYIGYYVGGGATWLRKGDAPLADEGTWGWDYQGWLPRRVKLNWWHGRRYQGGVGAYRTDGPKLPEVEHGHGQGHE